MATTNQKMPQLKEHPNKRGGECLEQLVSHIGREMRPFPERPPYTLQEFVWKFTKFMNLREMPIRAHIERLLEELGIFWEIENKEYAPTFFYEPNNRRWEIHTSSMEDEWTSIKILHEVFEIVCWRCYYRIPWWKQWAASQGMTNPHDKAEEFAFLVVLPDGKFRALAKKMKYDLWALAGVCRVPSTVCFQALNRHIGFDYPMFHAWLRCEQQPPLRTLSMFDEPEQECWALVKKKGLKGPKPDPEEYSLHGDFEALTQWSAVWDLDNLSKTGTLICMERDDVVETARRRAGLVVTRARRVAGVPLGGMATVIIRTPKNSIASVYLQVIPIGCEQQHLGINSYAALL